MSYPLQIRVIQTGALVHKALVRLAYLEPQKVFKQVLVRWRSAVAPFTPAEDVVSIGSVLAYSVELLRVRPLQSKNILLCAGKTENRDGADMGPLAMSLLQAHGMVRSLPLGCATYSADDPVPVPTYASRPRAARYELVAFIRAEPHLLFEVFLGEALEHDGALSKEPKRVDHTLDFAHICIHCSLSCGRILEQVPQHLAHLRTLVLIHTNAAQLILEC